MVKNCARNRSIPDEIDTETEICTSLKSEFYSCISVLVFVTICGKIMSTAIAKLPKSDFAHL